MPQVSVTINGRRFGMACENGEEPRLMRLAEDLDARIAKLRASFGDIGDTRLTIMAALALADELSEKKEKLQRLEHSPLCTMRALSRLSATRRQSQRSSPHSMQRLSASRASLEDSTPR
jgi:cell division protein ZapA